jgi:hypothetical protein
MTRDPPRGVSPVVLFAALALGAALLLPARSSGDERSGGGEGVACPPAAVAEPR